MYSPRDFYHNFLQTFMQFSKTCLGRTISRSHYDLMETKSEVAAEEVPSRVTLEQKVVKDVCRFNLSI